METNRLLSKIIVVFFILFSTSVLFTGCKKDKEEKPTGPYTNLNDYSTTDLELNLLRMELSPLRSTDIKMYLSVTDQEGNPLTDFNEYNFEIKEVCTGETDTTLVGTLHLSKPDQQNGKNIAAAMTLDYSGSMGDDDLSQMEDAVKTFVGFKEHDDYMEIIKFGTEVTVAAPFTNDRDILNNAIDNIPYDEDRATAFYDAVFTGLSDGMELYENHSGNVLPVILGFTDGKDNRSHITRNNLVLDAQLKQVPIYTIGYGSEAEYTLNYIAEETGGRYFSTPDAEELADLYTTISGQLKKLYLVEWQYDNPDCDKVTVIVKVTYTCGNGTLVAFANKKFIPLD